MLTMTARTSAGLIFIAAICAGCASQGTSPALDTSQAATAEPVSAQTAPAPDRAAGMRVYKDPQTGEFTAPPTAEAVPREGLVTTAPVDLRETVSTVPGGGIKVDLQGRFRSHFIATKDADGNVSVRCVPEQELPKP
ncbi:MAG: hypothetical protein A2150_05395 [Candidatus Muproteobacteria bacterium RBG_16_64_11]|uniref:Secreted protein n=1 Tax=Candidatus Muproteobacteria bacterium RBG_16_64_11 TaxID=1817758 RepID=A0A1F6TBY5_9PROT|nr:MAG: hypothetical protein A2150_05395 [Candidatus Muproteobacteria bacterium RBG_16_64_11]